MQAALEISQKEAEQEQKATQKEAEQEKETLRLALNISIKTEK